MPEPSPWEPVTHLRRIPIVECGESLVDFLSACPPLKLDRPRYRYRRETLLRRTVVEKLCVAVRLLPTGYTLRIIEGWRAPHIQARMYRATWNWWRERHPDWSEAALRRIVNRNSAPVTDPRVPPPHTTGGAFDVMLADMSGPVDLCSPYDMFDPLSYPFDAPNLSVAARRNRLLLHTTLEAVGITNYHGEYWHWSYGDQGWAYRGGHAQALYAAITPTHWQPWPEELTDDPLEAFPLSDG